VKILLGREEVSPDFSDCDSCTPLSYAASRGYKGIVRILLRGEEVDPGSRILTGGHRYRMPLRKDEREW